jgi:ABC-2 type transport system permease protein
VSTVLALAGLRWRQLRRDPTALVFTLVVPLAIGAVLGANFLAGEGRPPLVGVVVEHQGPVSRDLAARLADNGLVQTVDYPNRAAAARAVRRHEVAAAVVVPATVDGPAGPDGASSAVALIGPPGVQAPGGVRAAVETTTAETAAVVTAGRALAPADPLGRGLDEARSRLAADRPAGGGLLDSADHLRNRALGAAVIGALVLFTFANTMGMSASLVGYRELGLLARMRATPASVGQVAGGYVLALGSYAVIQALLILLTGTVLFGVAWGQPVLVVAMAVGIGAAAGALGALTGTLLPSSTAGTTIGGPAGFVLGMVAGCLWPLEAVDPILGTVAHVTPHAWAIDGLRAVLERQPVGDVAVSLAMLAVFAAVSGLIAAVRLSRLMHRVT